MKPGVRRTPVIGVLVPSIIRNTPPLFETVQVGLTDWGNPYIATSHCVRGHRMVEIQDQITFFAAEIKQRLAHLPDVAGCVLVSNNWDTAMRIQAGLLLPENGIERARDFICCPRTDEDKPYDHDPIAGLVLRLLIAGSFGVVPKPSLAEELE